VKRSRLAYVFAAVLTALWILLALFGPVEADADVPLPKATAENFVSAAFAISPIEQPAESWVNGHRCIQKNSGGWRCPLTVRWKPARTEAWTDICRLMVVVWNRGYRFRGLERCPGLHER